MNNILNTIASSVFPRDLSSYSTDELKRLTEEYPFAGALQLLYAERLRNEGSEDFDRQWQKNLLYFNDPLFLRYAVTASDVDKKISTQVIATEPGGAPVSQTSEEIEQSVPQDEEPVDEDMQETIAIPGLKIEPIDPEKASFGFTPYYTVDYFASQGIKLGDNIKSSDRFGNQLRTFTSWLKEMRRLPETEVATKFSLVEQNKVEKMAESSLSGENAITDAMAEVWIKQGNRQKAIDIYRKLSLKNPAKSAFFAAKIEFLKKQL